MATDESARRSDAPWLRAVTFGAWVLPHVVGLVLAVRTGHRGPRAPRGVVLVAWLWTIAFLVVGVAAWAVDGVTWPSKRWEAWVALAWIGPLLPFLRVPPRMLGWATALALSAAGLWTLGVVGGSFVPRWTVDGTAWVEQSDGEWGAAHVWRLDLLTLPMTSLEATVTGGGSPGTPGTVWLTSAATATPHAEGRHRWPNEPYASIQGTWTDGTPLGGRTFRVSGTFDFAEAGEPSACRGWSFAWREDGERVRTCTPARWSAGPSEVTREVTIPSDVSATRLEVAWFDVGGVAQRVEGVTLWEVVDGEARSVATGWEARGRVGQPDVDEVGAFRTTVHVRLPIGVAPEDLVRVDGGPRVGFPTPMRLQGLGPHPNVWGHRLALAVAVVLALPVARRWRLLAVVLGLVAVAASDSRSAIAVAVGLVALHAVLRSRGVARAAALATLAAGVAALAAWSDRFATLLRFSGPSENLYARSDIHGLAVRALAEAPWLGFGNGLADDLARMDATGAFAPAHAHNAWLHLGTVFGAPLMGLALIATVALVAWALRRAVLRRLTLVAPLVALSVVDVAAVHATFAFPAALALVTLVRHEATEATDG